MRHVISAFGCCFFTGSAAERMTAVYVSLLSALLPLAVHNGYFDITEAKQAVFCGLGCAYLLALAVLFCLRRARPALCAAFEGPLQAADWALLAFVFCGITGAALSGSADAFLARESRYQGVASLLLYALTWFGVTRLFRAKGAYAVPALAAFAAVSALAALQRCGVDAFGLRASLLQTDRSRFLSTIGNIDFYGAYLCLVLPALPYLLCRAKGRAAKACLAALLLAGTCGAVSAGGDGAGVALLAGALLAPLLLKGRPEEARRLLSVYVAMLATAQGFALLAAGAESGYYFSHLTRLILRPAVSGALAALCLAGLLLLKGRRTERVYKAYVALLLAGALALATAVALVSTVWADVPLGPYARFLRLDESWGTDRGRIWRVCLEAYRAFPWWKRLFGAGPDCVLLADSLAPLFSDALVDTAHCEYLQYLLASGALGLAAYAALLLGVCARLLRARTPAAHAFLLALASYAVQAVVGIAQPTTTPLFFLFIAVAQAYATRVCAPFDSRAREC